MTPPTDLGRAALRHLRRRDPALRSILDRVGPFTLTPEPQPFAALVSAIIAQQLSVKAANTIEARVRALVKPKRLTPAGLLGLTAEQLRAAGLSGAKAAFLHDLAAKVRDRHVRLNALAALEDEAVIEALTLVKGIGRWTAEMFLIFSLGRPDVLPVDDLGLRAGVMVCDGLAEMPSREAVRLRAEVWRPYRSVATWYLWRYRDLPGVRNGTGGREG